MYLKKICLLFIPFLFSACIHSGYAHRSQSARNAFEDGNYAQALKWYESQKPPERDKLLFLLDRGTILHTAGRYAESLKIFNEAIDLSERTTAAHAPSKTASLLTNDQLIPYDGEKFEKLLMHVFQVMNYLGMNQPTEALVEVRRIHTKFDDYFKEGSKSYLKNAFATYLSGSVWEKNHKNNDAFIDYKATSNFTSEWNQLIQDLLRTSRRAGLGAQYQTIKKKYPTIEESTENPNNGELIAFVGEGWIPQKYSTEENQGLQVVPVPRYPDIRIPPPVLTLLENGSTLADAKILYRVDEAARDTLSDNMPGIITRAIARLAAKEGTAVAVGKEVDKNLGIFLGFLFLATNEADLRSWLTLPRSFQVLRISLPAGTHQLKLRGFRTNREFSVDIKKGEPSFVSLRVF
ncbi:MAG: hypothetical protein IPJ69_02415 [Deltaproteobacteria bacterium]|nr:MAG: hypothetical protein IPJ69_02415 [Deltaproteobacteria bacterium]